MKTRKIIIEVICIILLMNWFYEGIYKIAYFHQFGFYITHAPLLKSIGGALKYIIPFGEIGLSILIILPRYRMIAIYTTIGVLLVYIFWIMSVYLFTYRVFWPFHALWEKPSWMQKMLISLGFCWMAFTVIALSGKYYIVKPKSTTLAKLNVG